MATWHQQRGGGLRDLWAPLEDEWKCVMDRPGQPAGSISFSSEAEARRYCERTGAVLVPPRRKNPRRKPTKMRIYDRLRAVGYTARDAHRIAAIHEQANLEGFSVEWGQDDFDDRSGIDHSFPLWVAIARDPEGKILDSLGGVDLGEVGPDAHHSDPYQWDVEAQVLDEAMREAR